MIIHDFLGIKGMVLEQLLRGIDGTYKTTVYMEDGTTVTGIPLCLTSVSDSPGIHLKIKIDNCIKPLLFLAKDIKSVKLFA